MSTFVVLKYLVTAAVVVAVSEVAKRGDRAGAVLSSLPLVTVMTMVWLHLEKQPASAIANHAYYTFFYVVPTLPMFLAFPGLQARLGFWPALAASAILTGLSFVAFAYGVRRFGVELL